ncbi:VOC family protein [Prolixibacter bellariivorans]|nr:VOC family protein [Prolixibacter bellariivorans]
MLQHRLTDTNEFRFYYFTNRYADTVNFYKSVMQLEEVRSWDRGHCNKGTIFKFPKSEFLLEVEESEEAPSFYGAGLYMEVDDVDDWYRKAVAQRIQIKQPISDTSYGHRSFKMEDPNGLTIGLFQYI